MLRWLALTAWLWIPATAHAVNEDTTLILHAEEPGSGVDCVRLEETCDARAPNVRVEAGDGLIALYPMLRNYDEVCQVGFRLLLEGGVGSEYWGDWIFLVAVPVCRVNQFTSRLPSATNGEFSTSFDIITGGSTAVLLFCFFIVGTSGCIGIGETHDGFASVFDCSTNSHTQISPPNRGTVCVGKEGYGACDPAGVAVEGATWGRIKAQHR